ncbi:hypothetical protein D3C78_460350 [compost metagenome]
MDGRLEIAMQIEHHVRIAGMAQQQALHALKLGTGRRQLVQRLDHGLADQRDVGLFVGTEALADTRGDQFAQLDEVAVEVLPAAQLETAEVAGLQGLAEADGVGHRNQFDTRLQKTFGLQIGKTLLQLPGGTHARQLIGVQAGLDVDLALASAEAEHAQAALAAETAPRQQVIDTFHSQSLSVCAVRDKPGSGARPS